MKKTKKLLMAAMLGLTGVTAMACSPFVFIGGSGITPFKDTKNCIFFALYNYYGIEGQHFTNKWMGMNDALADHGVIVTGWEAEKDAKKFKIDYLPDAEVPADKRLPKDKKIVMVNNQTWDIGLQYNKPMARHKPMAIISTCNGVEFAANPIKSSGIGTQNATIGSFSKNYREAMKDGSLAYLVSKYTAHVAPIFAACVDAVDNGKAMRTTDGGALQLSVQNWHVKSLEEYDTMNAVDQYEFDEETGIHPTILKNNLDPFFNKNDSKYGAEALTNFVADSSFETITNLYHSNDNVETVKRTGDKIKAGLLVPGSVNDTVQGYIDYMTGYLADAYNVEFLPNEAISSTNTQIQACDALINKGADFIISLQDDLDRNMSIKNANDKGVFYGIAGTCQNPADYEATKDYPYFVGSIGTSIEEERRSAKIMTEYYLQAMIDRGVVEEK